MLILGFVWNYHISTIGGSAIGGRIHNGCLYIKTLDGIFLSVSLSQWIFNMIIGCMTFLFAFIFFFSLLYFFLLLLIRFSPWKKKDNINQNISNYI